MSLTKSKKKRKEINHKTKSQVEQDGLAEFRELMDANADVIEIPDDELPF